MCGDQNQWNRKYSSVLILNGSPSWSHSSVSSSFSRVAGGSSPGELSVNNGVLSMIQWNPKTNSYMSIPKH